MALPVTQRPVLSAMPGLKFKIDVAELANEAGIDLALGTKVGISAQCQVDGRQGLAGRGGSAGLDHLVQVSTP